MDETTRNALDRNLRRTANAERLYIRAEGLRELATEIDRQLALPDHQRPVGDEVTQALEAKLLRQRADELTHNADGIQQRLHEPNALDRTQEIEDWAERLARGPEQDRSR